MPIKRNAQSPKQNDHDQGEHREWNRQIAGCPPQSPQYGAVKAWSICWNSRRDWIDVWRQSVVSSQWDFHAHPQASHLVLSCACITLPLLPDLISFLLRDVSHEHPQHTHEKKKNMSSNHFFFIWRLLLSICCKTIFISFYVQICIDSH